MILNQLPVKAIKWFNHLWNLNERLPMALLTQDKIKQLRSQLEQCVDPKTSKACKTAIIRLESQLRPTRGVTTHIDPIEVLLEEFIQEGTVKVYHPTHRRSHL